MQIISKLPQVGTTIFTVMSALANEVGAVNLSQGFPDFPIDNTLAHYTHEAMQKGLNQYAPMAGLPLLREALAHKLSQTYHFNCSPAENITITSGATEALFAAITALVSEGDEVIIFEPAYDSYVPAIELNKGVAIRIALTPESYQIDWQKVKESISPRTKAILINTPHNPTGTVLSQQDLLNLVEVVRNTNIWIISDEVYEHIIFDNIRHESVLHYPELRERSMAIYSFGKTFHATGWKIGYCVAPAEATKEFRKVHQFLTFSTVTPMQYALAIYLQNPENYLHLPSFYEKKRNTFAQMMQETPFQLLPCQGTYFQLASYKHLSDEKDTDYTIRLTKEVGVATIPVSVFYQEPQDHKVIRFCFAKKEETLARAVEKLIKHKEKLYQPQTTKA
ncbi:MAG: methionine aminotransferase [Microscillaceae bacterium]|nr:methionine aminotransferase [Microscillaceae bacterium]MDW8460775.1 methionine aminotransferase [Cytophagales bacterium]